MRELPRGGAAVLVAVMGWGDAHAASRPDVSYRPLTVVCAGTGSGVRVGEVPAEIRTAYGIDPFYTKCAVVQGIPIIGSDRVTDYAILEAACTLDHLLDGRDMPVRALARAKVRLGVMAVTEYTMDIPENRGSGLNERPAYWDRRARGLGGLPLATCAEENLLNLRGDPYVAENITIHEFSHTVANAIREADPAWYARLRKAYQAAMEAGRYGKSYATTNEQEYWAEGAQAWFDCANPSNTDGARNRDDVKAKDRALAALLTEVYGDGAWRYHKTTSPARAKDVGHLAGLDRKAMPAFDFERSPRIQAEKAAKRN